MKTSLIKALFGATATAVSLISMTGSANALSLSRSTLSIGFECNNDMMAMVLGNNSRGQWQYVNDAARDGIGGANYDFYGMGFMEDATHVYFTINTHNMQINAGRDTVDSNGNTQYKIGYGDLLINTRGTNLGAANGRLFGINFGANSGGASQVGLYANVTATSVAKQHAPTHEYVTGVLASVDGYHTVFNNFLPTLPRSVQDQYQAASQRANLNLNDYLRQQPSDVQQRYQQASGQYNLSFTNYRNQLPQDQRQAFQQATGQLGQQFSTYLQQQTAVWTPFNNYVNSRPSSVRSTYNTALGHLTTSFDTYLSQQPSSVRDLYKRGDQNTINRLNSNYNTMIEQARNTVANMVNGAPEAIRSTVTSALSNYGQLNSNARSGVNSIRNDYDRAIWTAGATMNEIRVPYDRIVADGTAAVNQIKQTYDAPFREFVAQMNRTLFGSLTREQGSAYFDARGSHVIASGTFLSPIEMLTLNQLRSVGYDSSRFQGGQTVAFRIARSEFREVPEPTTILGLAGIGLALASGKLRKRTAAE